MNRAEVLDTAKQAVTVDRQADHGAPEDTFGLIARLWTAYLDEEISTVQVAMMLALLKIARQRSNWAHDDNYVDLAGYAACAAELAAHTPLSGPVVTWRDNTGTVTAGPGMSDVPITKAMVDQMVTDRHGA